MAIHRVTSTTQASIYRINFYDNDIRIYKDYKGKAVYAERYWKHLDKLKLHDGLTEDFEKVGRTAIYKGNEYPELYGKDFMECEKILKENCSKLIEIKGYSLIVNDVVKIDENDNPIDILVSENLEDLIRKFLTNDIKFVRIRTKDGGIEEAHDYESKCKYFKFDKLIRSQIQ